jgi:ParB-like chromosome segregation protein Spo0J
MNIREVPLHEIKPYENNAKEHPVAQLEAIANSIKGFGFRQPLVLDKNNVIVVGHARYEAAAALGLETVPCEYADDLSEDEVNAYRILDNEIAKQGFTKLPVLKAELAKVASVDLSLFNLKLPSIPKLEVPKLDKLNESAFLVTIKCNNESEQAKLYDEMQSRGFQCKPI